MPCFVSGGPDSVKPNVRYMLTENFDELSVLSRQCLRTRRFGTAAALDDEVNAWVADRTPLALFAPSSST